MVLENIEFTNGLIRLYINDLQRQECIVVEVSVADFFNKLALAFIPESRTKKADKAKQ